MMLRRWSTYAPQTNCRLLCLPGELRSLIYYHVFNGTHVKINGREYLPEEPTCRDSSWNNKPSPLRIQREAANGSTFNDPWKNELALLRTCHQAAAEATDIAYSYCVFDVTSLGTLLPLQYGAVRGKMKERIEVMRIRASMDFCIGNYKLRGFEALRFVIIADHEKAHWPVERLMMSLRRKFRNPDLEFIVEGMFE
jgi:hypothetical protein